MRVADDDANSRPVMFLHGCADLVSGAVGVFWQQQNDMVFYIADIGRIDARIGRDEA